MAFEKPKPKITPRKPPVGAGGEAKLPPAGNSSPPSPNPAASTGDNLPKIELWNIEDLKPHPLQDKYFNDLPEAQFNEFVENIRVNGMREPIVALPKPRGIMIDGKQRRRANIRLGNQKVEVRVRYDLADASDERIELEFIEANRHRRQLSKIEQARIYKRVRELKEDLGEPFSRGDLTKECAARYGMSGRNLVRYVALLDRPKELQDAVDNKKLSLVKALRLMDLDPAAYDPILEALRNGRDVRRMVDDVLPLVPRAAVTDKKFERDLRNWMWQAEQLSEDMERVARTFQRRSMANHKARHLERLHKSQTVIEEMLGLLEGGNASPELMAPDSGAEVAAAEELDELADEENPADGDLAADEEVDPYGDEPMPEEDDQDDSNESDGEE